MNDLRERKRHSPGGAKGGDRVKEVSSSSSGVSSSSSSSSISFRRTDETAGQAGAIGSGEQ